MESRNQTQKSFLDSLKVETAQEYLMKKLEERGLQLQNFKGMASSYLTSSILNKLGDFNWFNGTIYEKGKEAINERLDNISIEGNKITIRDQDKPNEKEETVMAYDDMKDMITMTQRYATSIVEKIEDKYLEKNSAMTKTMYMDKYGQTLQIDCESYDNQLVLYSEPPFTTPGFIEENDYKHTEGIKKMRAINDQVQYMGKDGKVVTTKLTKEMALDMQSSFGKTNLSPIQIVEEQLSNDVQEQENSEMTLE